MSSKPVDKDKAEKARSVQKPLLYTLYRVQKRT